MTNTVLITGGYGFLGRNCAKYFKEKGYYVIGLGHGAWMDNEHTTHSFDNWMDGDVCTDTLLSIAEIPNIIVHCGGSGSVGFSVQEPYLDFKKTVDSTAAVLEYMRIYAPNTKLVYPSSPAVHGLHDNTPIKITDPMKPTSPYGLHKKMAEELCLQYAKEYAVDVSIIRFFSIYGEGLRKQLLWDACNKIISADSTVEFWGAGDETRDFIHIDDAVRLVYKVATGQLAQQTVNGGTGVGHSVSEILNLIKFFLNSDTKIIFNGQNRIGDPKYYTADTTGWIASVPLVDGLKRYVDWFLTSGQKK